MLALLAFIVWMREGALCSASLGTTKKQLFIGYDHGKRPHHLGEPETIRVDIGIEALLHVDQRRCTYSMNGYFRLYWKDPRLAFVGADEDEQLYFDSAKSGDFKIWTPDIYIHQGIKLSFASAAGGGEGVIVSQDGSVFWTRHVSAELHCKGFSFGQLPFDIQRCGITVSDYTYSDKVVVVEWAEGGDLPNFGPMEIEEWDTRVISTSRLTQHYATGNMSCAVVCMKLSRDSQSFATTIIVAVLLVVASYTGFWIPAAATPARVALAFLCFLMVLTNLHAVQQKLPPLMLTHRVWLIDFLAGCSTFCFASLLEYGLVSAGLADIAKKKAAAEADEKSLLGANRRRLRHAFEGQSESESEAEVRPEPWFNLSKLVKLDEICRCAFPLVFVIFACFIFFALPLYQHADGCTY